MPTYRVEINSVIKKLMREHPGIVLLGQSIRDPYGGACKVTRGLTKEFDARIFDMPISEAGMIGAAIGMSMNGWLPIVEIMFSDFLTLIVNQICNVANVISCKHQKIKIIIRTMDNAGSWYGATHSQNMFWLLRAMPVLFYRVENIELDYVRAIKNDFTVTILIEDKSMYSKKIRYDNSNLLNCKES